MILIGLTPAIDSIFLQKITDSIELYTENSESNLSQILMKWVIIYVVWWESLNIIWRLYDYFYLKAIPVMKGIVINEFYKYIQSHNHDFFQSSLAGEITGRITEASRSLEMIFANLNEKVLRKSIVLMTSIIILYSIHAIIALIFVIWLASFMSISLGFAKKINQYAVEFNRNKVNISGHLVDSITNISIVQMFSSQKFERAHLNRSVDKMINSDRQLQWFMLKIRYVLGLSCSILIGCLIYYMINLRSENLISTGQCVIIITLCITIINDIWDLTQELGDLFEYTGSFNQSIGLLKINDEKNEKNANELIIQNPDIKFINVTFNYRQNHNNFVNQSLEIKAKERIGLAGFSGSGKTTFVRMITRIYEIHSGKILIDGQNIADVSLKSLNQNISFISQEPMLFHRSIRENIAYAKPNASDEEIIEAAKNAHIHDYIMSLPENYNTICGERGNNLSGGQRQRISIARAFLKPSPILIIDEATSALDSHTEKMIQHSLEKLMQDKTVIVIAHRLTTLLHMDRILVFKDGHVIEDGAHEKLIKDSNVYKLLWENYGILS